MAFELPTLPFPRDSYKTPYIASPDDSGKYTTASGQWFKKETPPGSGVFLWVPVSTTDPLPVGGTVGIDQSTPGTTNKVVAELSGSQMELYGATINDRPAANAVPVGATFTIVDENLDQNWISNGTDWMEV
jgi:hypothetical protein